MTGTSVVTVPGERDESIPPTPARQGILQALPSALGLVLTLGTLVAITWHAGQSLTNGDTYFHLRFGHEFLTGHWSLSASGQRDELRHQRLGADPVAAADRDGPGRGLVRAARRRVAAGPAPPRARGDVVGHRPPSRRPIRRGDDPDPGAVRRLTRPVHAAAGHQLPAGRRDHGSLDVESGRRPGALVAGAPHLGLGDVSWHVAGRHRHRPGGRRRDRPRPGAAATRPAQARGGAGGLRGGGGPHAGGPGPVSRRAAGRLARAVLRRVAAARLHAAGQRRPAGAARPGVGPDAAPAIRVRRGPRSCWSGWPSPGRSTRPGPPRWPR